MDDILHFDPRYRVIICKPCQYTLVPREIQSHLKTHHQEEEGLTKHQIADLCRRFLTYPFQPPELVSNIQVLPVSPPIQFLRLYHDGFCCKLCPLAKPYVCRTKGSFGKHLKTEYQRCRHQGAPTIAERLANKLEHVATFLVAYQTFFKRGLFIRYFPVQPTTASGSSATDQGVAAGRGVQALSIPEQMELQLSQKLAVLTPAVSTSPGLQHFSLEHF